MTFNSKRTGVSIITGIVITIIYIFRAMGQNAPPLDDMKEWATTIIIFIGIGIALQILVQICFHITMAIAIAAKEQNNDDKEVGRIISSTVLEDEREKSIQLKVSRYGYIIAGIGFICALISLILELPFLFAIHIILGSFALASFIESIISICFYERGF